MTNCDNFIILICKKPVDCSDMSGGNTYDLGNRKRRSGLKEFPLIAQLSTSIQVKVTEPED